MFSDKGEATNFVGNFIYIKEDLLVNERRTNATNMECYGKDDHQLLLKYYIDYKTVSEILRPMQQRFVSNKSLLSHFVKKFLGNI